MRCQKPSRPTTKRHEACLRPTSSASKVDTSSPTISATAFASLKADVDAKLPAGVQASLVTWTAPSRVVDSCAMSITSALAFGYNSKYCGGCAARPAPPTLIQSRSSLGPICAYARP